MKNRFRNKKFYILITIFFSYLLSLIFFKSVYINIYHKDPLSFYISCNIQQYRAKVLFGSPSTNPHFDKQHFLDHAIKPLLNGEEHNSGCDSVEVISYNELYKAMISYYHKYLSETLSKDQFSEIIENSWITNRIKDSPNIYIWDRDFWYFSIVTATTTGYGDILPRSEEARSWVGFQILFSTFIAGLSFAIMGIKF